MLASRDGQARQARRTDDLTRRQSVLGMALTFD